MGDSLHHTEMVSKQGSMGRNFCVAPPCPLQRQSGPSGPLGEIFCVVYSIREERARHGMAWHGSRFVCMCVCVLYELLSSAFVGGMMMIDGRGNGWMDGRTNGWPDGCGGEVTNCSKNLSTVFALRAYAEFGSECESESESICLRYALYSCIIQVILQFVLTYWRKSHLQNYNTQRNTYHHCSGPEKIPIYGFITLFTLFYRKCR